MNIELFSYDTKIMIINYKLQIVTIIIIKNLNDEADLVRWERGVCQHHKPDRCHYFQAAERGISGGGDVA